MINRGKYLYCGSILAMAISAELHAQEQPRAFEEIVVTAQRRAETAQEVPIAIDVITGDTFIREGVRDVRDLAKMSTDLEINTNNSQINIIGLRGVQQSSFQPNDPLTAVHIDGAYLGSVYGLNGLMFDLERVEVLAGPQGTLYGRNSVAGAVNLLSKRPGDRFEANGMVEYGSEDTVRIGGGITVPLGDSFSARLAAQKFTRDALFSDGASEVDNWSSRLSAIWNITDQDELFITADYSDFGGTNDATTLLGINYDARLPNGQPAPAIAAYGNSPTLRDPYNVLPYTTQRGFVFFGNNQQENLGAMLQYTHDFGTFSSVLQYARRELRDTISRSHTRAATSPVGGILPELRKTNTVELRLLSDSGGPLEWVAGGFYYDNTGKGWSSQQTTTTDGHHEGPDPVTGLDIPWCPCALGFYPNYGDAWSYAAYAQATWTPQSLDKLHITGGVRYTKDWKDGHVGQFAQGRPVTAFGVPGMPPAVQAEFAPYLANGTVVDVAYGDNNREWDKVTWKIGAEYELGDNSMIYASVSTGFKSGAITYGPTPVLEPEELLAYEIGTKNQFFNNTLQFNASAWYYIDENFEGTASRILITPIQLPNGVTTSLGSPANVGEANIAGFSSDIDWLVTDNDQLGFSATYAWSEIKNGYETLPFCAAVLTCSLLPPGSQNRIFNEGERMGDAPKWVLLGRYSHTFNLANGATVNPSLKYQWQSEKLDLSTVQNTAFYPTGKLNEFSAIPSRGILDVSVKFTSASGAWDVTAYANNVADELVMRSRSYDANPGSATYGLITGTLSEPRTVGVILSARFE